jgi:hypothetical protein
MNRPHFHKPFPIGFYDNSKLKRQHVFVFDILCRHLDTGEDDWIRTDSRTMISLLKKTAGLNVQTPKKLLSSLQEWGYIEVLEPTRSRTVDERNNAYTLLAIRVLDSAWDPKPVVRVYNLQNRDEYMRIRYEKRKALLAARALES